LATNCVPLPRGLCPERGPMANPGPGGILGIVAPCHSLEPDHKIHDQGPKSGHLWGRKGRAGLPGLRPLLRGGRAQNRREYLGRFGAARDGWVDRSGAHEWCRTNDILARSKGIKKGMRARFRGDITGLSQGTGQPKTGMLRRNGGATVWWHGRGRGVAGGRNDAEAARDPNLKKARNREISGQNRSPIVSTAIACHRDGKNGRLLGNAICAS